MSSEDQIEDPVSKEESIINQLTQLKRSMAGFLAHKIPFSLFEAGKGNVLHQTLDRLVTERLTEQHINLEPDLKTRLIEEIYNGFPVKKLAPVETTDPYSIEKLRPQVASYMAHYLSNDLLMPGHERALARKVQVLVYEKLALEHINIGEEKTYALIKVLCESLNVEAPPLEPSALTPKEPEKIPEPVPTPEPVPIGQDSSIPLISPAATFSAPPPPSFAPMPLASVAPSASAPHAQPVPLPPILISPEPAPPVLKVDTFAQPPVPPEKSPTKKVPRLSLKAKKMMEGKEFEELEFTEQHKRELLYTLGTRLDPSTMSTGETKLIYKHIMEVLDQVCEEENLELDNDIKQLLLNGILSGEGLEFQL